MVKILHVAETIKGGVATIIRQLTGDATGFDIHCIVPDTQISELRGSKANLHVFERTGRNISSFIQLAKVFVKNYKGIRPDIIHIHSSFAGFICRGILFFLPGKPKVVYCPHAFSFLMDSSEFKKKCYAFIERILARKTDSIICVSHYEYDEALKRGLNKNKLQVIYNGVEPPVDISDIDKNENKQEGVLDILFVGRLDYQKGFDIVENVAKNLDDKCRIVVVGGGVLSDPKLSHSANIQYAGWVGKEDIAAFYAKADVLLMPSRWESFGLVAVEAQSYGVPVVASRCSSIPEVISDGETGFLFDVGDADEACRILLSLDRKTIGGMSERSVAYYKENFTSEKMIDKTFHLYKAL
ncbi:group 1 glycosyl transferase [Klebsiella oxytoca]|nr:group 1 glycosyl transferase [Klebsiella oxytoca]HEO8931534.1 glycosyltransferase [Serratia marcescens]HEP0989378.1 glycosyltransferase [Serratia marcescens]